VPMLVAMLSADLTVGDTVMSVLLFPFAVWGPALALAVWGYVARRMRQGPVDGPSTGSGRVGVDRIALSRIAAG
jgi:hypothetical protein